MKATRQVVGPTTLVRLWALGVARPAEACSEAWRLLKQPAWSFQVVLAANVITALTTLPLAALVGREPLLPSWLTFLPTEQYYRWEIAFLPVLRTLVWLLGAAIAHLGLRLAGRASDIDAILTAGAVANLVLFPFVWLFDWTAVVTGEFLLVVVAPAHAAVALWSVWITASGQRRLLRVPLVLALLVNGVALLLTLPFLAIFAR